MKNRKLITLGITLVSATLALAQETDVVRGRNPLPPDRAAMERDLAMQGQRAQLATQAERLAEEVNAQTGRQNNLMLAQAGGGAFGYEAGADSFTTMPARSPRALVIPKEAGDSKSFTEVEEDLGVMAHILDKAVAGGDKTARAMGITVSGRAFVAGAATPQNLYVEGYGAIFLLKVNFPLQPPPNKEPEAEAKEPVNNEWEEAKREMTRPGGKGQGGADPFVAFEERYGAELWNAKSPSAEYDADKVEDLKKDVIGALKNAANVRRLKADETITVVVSGADARMMTKSIKSSGGRYGIAKSDAVTVSKTSSGERTKVSGGAKLIFRVRKADAEAFQNGKLDLDAFSKKVAVIAF